MWIWRYWSKLNSFIYIYLYPRLFSSQTKIWKGLNRIEKVSNDTISTNCWSSNQIVSFHQQSANQYTRWLVSRFGHASPGQTARRTSQKSFDWSPLIRIVGKWVVPLTLSIYLFTMYPAIQPSTQPSFLPSFLPSMYNVHRILWGL